MDQRNLRTDNIAYVGPNGGSNNVGSQVYPYGSIQRAVNELRDTLKASDQKIVRLLPGTYDESVVINAKNVVLEGVGDAIINGDGESPAVMVTNMSESGAEAYHESTGYAYTAAASFTYSGDATDQEVESGLTADETDMGVELRNVTLQKGDSSQAFMVLPSEDGGSEAVIGDVTIKDCDIDDEAVAKNTSGLVFDETVVDSGASVVLDNCQRVTLNAAVGASKNFGSLICRYKTTSLDSGEVKGKGVAAEEFFNHLSADINFKDAKIYSSEAGNSLRNQGKGLALTCNGTGGILTAGAGNVGKVREGSGALVGKIGPFVTEEGVTLKAAEHWVDRIECESLTYDNSGTSEVEAVYVDGALNVDGGTLKIYGGRIKGDVVTTNSATVELYNCTIDGQLDADGTSQIDAHQCRVGGEIITEGSCTINCHGCHAEGNLDANSNGGVINFKGGSFEGTNEGSAASATNTN